MHVILYHALIAMHCSQAIGQCMNVILVADIVRTWRLCLFLAPCVFTLALAFQLQLEIPYLKTQPKVLNLKTQITCFPTCFLGAWWV